MWIRASALPSTTVRGTPLSKTCAAAPRTPAHRHCPASRHANVPWPSATATASLDAHARRRLPQILIGGVDGDPNFDDNTGDGVIDRAIPAAQATTPANGIVSTIVTLPAGKTCNYCTLQWIWAARTDGGYYMGCSDISITTTGLLPNFTQLSSETGNELPQ